MRLLLALGLLLFARPAQAAEADVIVYGATPGGFCAAIAAAREGAKVVLLEPTAHVGGVNTLTVTNQDTRGFAIVDAFQLLPAAAPAK